MKISALFSLLIMSRLSLADPRDTVPSVDEFKQAMQSLNPPIGPNSCVFYTGNRNTNVPGASTPNLAARRLVTANPGLRGIWSAVVLDSTTPCAWTTDVFTPMTRAWSQAYGELCTGVAWVVFTDDGPINPNFDSAWNSNEFPALRANGVEVNQVSALDLTNIQQIFPVETRTLQGTCRWYGTAPLCDDSACPAGTTQQATSVFGNNFNMCQQGATKRYCCT